MKLDRRTLLVGSGAAGALVIAYAAWPRAERASLRPAKGELLLGPGIAIARDGRVTIAIPQVETGQGIWTGLAQVAADELGAAWESVGVTPARPGGEWGNALAKSEGWLDGLSSWREWRLGEGAARITAGSTSIRAMEAPMRRLGAGARALLVAEAAARWKVRAGECDSANGFVTHEGRSLPFAALAEGAAGRTLPGEAPLRAGRGALVGKPLPRLEAAPKADGRLRFAGDVRLPGMLHASLRRSGAGQVRIESAAPAGIRFASGEDWVAALAEDWWGAEAALAKAKVTSFGLAAGNDAAVADALDRALASDDFATLIGIGDVETAFEGARPLAATYSAAAALHHDLEPPSVTARLADGLLEIWAATQAPELARRAAAEAAGHKLDRTILYPLPVGGQGGAALDVGLIPIAVALAREAGRPVQLTLSRAEQVRGDAVRAPLKARLYARPLPDGRIGGWRMRVAGVDGTDAAMRRLVGGDPGGFRAAAFSPLPYAIPNVALEAASATLPVQAGYHRGELYGALAFFTESFVDELARIGGRDPLSQRIALLGGNPRLARCLVRATALGGWDGGGPGSQMGLCAISAYGSFIAVVASASVGTGGQVEVSRLVAVVDCGRVVNPGLVRQQVEGGMIASLHQATVAAPSFRYGRVAGPLEASAPGLRKGPETLVEILPSGAAPGGVNGLGWVAAPAAVGNALAAASGRRLRSLPLNPMS
ncbi:molybdopterin cofactor-binding domain-containing protein [Sphingomonas astaxanthinifaciens]|uniref:Aldehyde dehydrogenase n=1 Tax=Sphingomonas astaxanthinifaciens DSM 22298 TaxID=1123267 RepID=A0ABQ5Z193_9SPHN|nr:molybdopterin cofactor-binding domain-containing protein [Sphingomonas astaxanthinifaciens]GLR46540.1 aldehyde dehydrogenase [Sphingomonas astaxanthinifaciens DSM 22298]